MKASRGCLGSSFMFHQRHSLFSVSARSSILPFPQFLPVDQIKSLRPPHVLARRGGRGGASIEPARKLSSAAGAPPLACYRFIQARVISKVAPLAAARRSRAKRMQPAEEKVEPLPETMETIRRRCRQQVCREAALYHQQPSSAANAVSRLKQSPRSFISRSPETRCVTSAHTRLHDTSADQCTACTPAQTSEHQLMCVILVPDWNIRCPG